MIVDWIISLLLEILKAFFGIFPTITELPWGTDATVTQAVGLYKGFALIFPPLQVILDATLIYIGVQLLIMLWSIVPIFGKMIHKKSA